MGEDNTIMDDREILIRQTVLLEEIGKKVTAVETKVNSMNDGHVMKTESRLAVLEEKNDRLEKVVYGSIAIITVQLISLIFLWLRK